MSMRGRSSRGEKSRSLHFTDRSAMSSVEMTRVVELGGIPPFALLRIGHPAFVVPRTNFEERYFLGAGCAGAC
jgi:hypothetical protein